MRPLRPGRCQDVEEIGEGERTVLPPRLLAGLAHKPLDVGAPQAPGLQRQRAQDGGRGLAIVIPVIGGMYASNDGVPV
jgi:hypothetical protein